MYSVKNVEGKGLGCIANFKIKRGTLIEKEEPVLKTPPGLVREINNGNIARMQVIVDKFKKMEKKTKEDYLKLSNKYKMNDKNQPYQQTIKEAVAGLNSFLDFGQLDLGDIDTETALQVLQIYPTNAFKSRGGVCLDMSRFNHSGVANAEYFWDEKEKVFVMRSISNIAEGEEITIRYGGEVLLDTAERRKHLSGWFFHCMCPACDLSEENLIEETKLCQKWRELEKRQPEEGDLNNILRDVDRFKEMYQIAKKLKTLKITTILKKIVYEGFHRSCIGYCIMTKVAVLDKLPERKMFHDDIQKFARVGVKLTSMLYGKEQEETRSWQREKENPIHFVEQNFPNVKAFINGLK